MCLNEQDSGYPLGPKYAKILNMAGFSICKFIQRSQYARICLDRALNIPWVLNMPGF